MWPLHESGRARASVGGGGPSSSSSLCEGGEGRAHVALEVCVGLRGEEEFHDGGVTFLRGQNERRPPREIRAPTLKERTEREDEDEGPPPPTLARALPLS